MFWRLITSVFILILNSVSGQNSIPFVVVLGVTQDGGYPHIGCDKLCCSQPQDSTKKYVTSLALADLAQKKWWLFEATPDIVEQLRLMQQVTRKAFNYLPDGIFITHAHIGHYTGLMYLGREALGGKDIPVYVLPKMADFLSSNGPWSQLVNLKNIKLSILSPDKSVELSNSILVKPFLVPHRDEYSETAGFKIQTSSSRYLFIPDIDKWSRWNRDLFKEVSTVDFAFLDATFYSADELPGRDISDIPHPLVTETMQLFPNSLEKSKVCFIHFNHTNPLLWSKPQQKNLIDSGFKLSVQGGRY